MTLVRLALVRALPFSSWVRLHRSSSHGHHSSRLRFLRCCSAFAYGYNKGSSIHTRNPKPTSVRHRRPSICPLQQAKFQSKRYLAPRSPSPSTPLLLSVAVQRVLHCCCCLLRNSFGRASSLPRDTRERVDITRPLDPVLTLTGRITHSLTGSVAGWVGWSSVEVSQSRVEVRSGWRSAQNLTVPYHGPR